MLQISTAKQIQIHQAVSTSKHGQQLDYVGLLSFDSSSSRQPHSCCRALSWNLRSIELDALEHIARHLQSK